MEVNQFSEMNLSAQTIKAIEEMGYVEPSPIQRIAIPAMMSGRDIIGQAQTGTGKTAAFGIPIIERLDLKIPATQAIVLTPTRELAIQVAEELNKLARNFRGVSIMPIYGGQSIERQIRALRMGVHIVVGTPGRVLDHLSRGTMKLDKTQVAVLDEADEMLDMGFLDDIKEILRSVNKPNRQVVLFSATMPPEIKALARQFQKDPEHIQVVHQELTVPKVTQFYYEVREREKPELLTRLIDFYNPNLAIVFVNTKVGVEELKEKIHAAGYSVEGLHGDLKQTQRDYVMKRFRNNDFDILIATDVAARGIDVDDIDIVFNYDLPQDEEYYVHRIGRTARAGREGMAVTFVTMKEFRKLKDIERYIKSRLERKQIPSLADVEKVRNQAFIGAVKECIDDGGLEKYVTAISEMLGDYTSMDVAAAMMKMMTERDTEDNLSQDDYSSRSGADEFVRFFITIGKRDNVTIKDLIKFVAENTNVTGREMGDIAFLEKFSFINIPAHKAPAFINSMKGLKFLGRRVNVEIATKR